MCRGWTRMNVFWHGFRVSATWNEVSPPTEAATREVEPEYRHLLPSTFQEDLRWEGRPFWGTVVALRWRYGWRTVAVPEWVSHSFTCAHLASFCLCHLWQCMHMIVEMLRRYKSFMCIYIYICIFFSRFLMLFIFLFYLFIFRIIFGWLIFEQGQISHLDSLGTRSQFTTFIRETDRYAMGKKKKAENQSLYRDCGGHRFRIYFFAITFINVTENRLCPRLCRAPFDLLRL